MTKFETFIENLSRENIDLLDKLDNLCGHGQISDEDYAFFSENKQAFFMIENYIVEILKNKIDNPWFTMSCLRYIEFETERLYEQDLIEEHDFSSGLYNCDELYLAAIQYVRSSLSLENEEREILE